MPPLAPLRRRCAQLGAACALSLLMWAATTGADGPSKRPAATPVPAEDLPGPRTDGGFVASDACRECHASEHASWHASYHRTMTQVATPEAVMGRFDGTVINSDGIEYRVFERDGEFWAELPDPDKVMDLVQMRGRDDLHKKIERVERRVIMTTGSHRYQTYWVAGDDEYGRLIQTLPLVYLPEENRWIPREQAFMRPPGDRFLTQWNHHCIKCHSTGGVPGLVNDGKRGKFDTRVAELGIACEACHGPGEKHIALHRRAAEDQPVSDDPIVNPASLDNQRANMVCGQCHGVFIASDAKHGMEYATQGESYRPGGDINISRYYIEHPANDPDARRQVEFQRNREFFRERWWDDGTILAGGREYTAMMNVGCVLRGEMSCFSCHSMHDSDPAGQIADGMPESQMCTQCHTEAQYTTDLTAHTHHAADSHGSNCLNCHMPNTAYALFKAIRSHSMSSPSIAASVEHGTPNACNLCHLDQTLAWSQEHTRDWYGHEPSELSEEQRETAAGVLWMLKGHAAQRAVVAWNAGWQPAREASGDEWLGLFASSLLADPYSVVRYISHKTLQKLPGTEQFEFDYLAGPEEREQAATNAMRAWWQANRGKLPESDAILLPAGKLDSKRFTALRNERDDRPVTVKE